MPAKHNCNGPIAVSPIAPPPAAYSSNSAHTRDWADFIDLQLRYPAVPPGMGIFPAERLMNMIDDFMQHGLATSDPLSTAEAGPWPPDTKVSKALGLPADLISPAKAEVQDSWPDRTISQYYDPCIY